MKKRADILLLVHRWKVALAWMLLILLFSGWDSSRLVSAQTAVSERPYLILISIDGLVPDYYNRPDRLGLRLPNMRRLCREGACAEGVIGVYPTVTFPSHTTLVTGARPADHGVWTNTVFDEPTQPPTGRWLWEASFIRTETLWMAAKKAGLSVACAIWPVTVGAQGIDWHIPEVWDATGPFKLISQTMRDRSTPGLIDDILRASNRTPNDYAPYDEFTVDAAVYMIERFKPNFLMVHLIDLDQAQHEAGPYSARGFEATERADAAIGRILEAIRRAGIEASTTVAIVSDHGFMRIDKEFHAGAVLAQAGLIRLNAQGQVISWDAAVHPSGASAAIYLKNPNDASVANRVWAAFEPYTKGPEAPLRRILQRDELDQLGANPRATFFLEPSNFYAITNSFKEPVIQPAPEKKRGNHGFLPERPEMYASLILWGRGIQRTSLEFVQMTDIAPTLARILNIPFQPPAYSQPITKVLAQPSKQAETQTAAK
ncbi:MAG: ectonucleotide pyrophosphatase/phosphodiesterase [Acidobacteriota bacterium]|nr:ectonucleotide pyrophosphatase/phosphodiesterase [Blastocatellia bacterium]MDW8240168.1 ectonucleotide pyrophosphatase/phosphodiesterase [Acidobacteriota bacterium]